jgi:hypothetical protein
VTCRTCPSPAVAFDRCMTCATTPLRRKKRKAKPVTRTVSVTARTWASLKSRSDATGVPMRQLLEQALGEVLR